MATPTGKSSKHSLYRPASPLERNGLRQGKLNSGAASAKASQSEVSRTTLQPGQPVHAYSPLHQYVDRRSEHRQTASSGVDPASSPRRPPPSPSTTLPTSEHTHSLSLSDSDSDTPPVMQHYTEPKPPTHIMPMLVPPGSTSKPVLVVNAEISSLPSHSTEVQVTTMETPSPVKVVKHHAVKFETQPQKRTPVELEPPPLEGDRNSWRRFSSNFVTPPAVRRAREEGRREGGGERPPHEHLVHSNVPFDVRDLSQLQDSGGSPAFEDTTLRALEHLAPMPTSPEPSHPPDHSSHDPSSHSTLLSGDSLDLAELSALAEAAHERVVGEGGGEGVGRSASEEAIGSRWKEHLTVDDTIHSKSLELSTIHEKSSSAEQSQVAGSKKKTKKGRVIPSRYMAAASSFKKPSQPPTSVSHQLSVSTNTSRTARKGGKASTVGKPPLSSRPKMADDSFKIPALPVRSRTSSRPPPHPSSFTPYFHLSSTPVTFTPSAITTSTPAFSGVMETPTTRPLQAFHDGSFMALDGGLDTTLGEGREPSTRGTGTTSKASKSVAKAKTQFSWEVTDWELELWHNRLLQAAYLDVLSAKALREQEEEAKAQLYTLWQAVEEKQHENAVMRKMIEAEERMQALEKALEVQLQGLGPVCGRLPQLEQQYSTLARALDTTRHEMGVSGIAPLSEDQLEAELAKSEQLLGEIIMVVREKVPKVSSFADSTDAIVKTLEKEFQELERCWEEVESASRTQIHETSLFFEERQRRQQSARSTAPLTL